MFSSISVHPSCAALIPLSTFEEPISTTSKAQIRTMEEFLKSRCPDDTDHVNSVEYNDGLTTTHISSDRTIGIWRQAALFVRARKSLMQPKTKVSQRRFSCYVSGFMQLSLGSPSRRWPVLTAEEEADEEVANQMNWERARDGTNGYEPLNGW